MASVLQAVALACLAALAAAGPAAGTTEGAVQALFANVQHGKPIIINLEPSVDESRRASLLMRLKQLHQSSARRGSLLEEREVPLDVEILSTKHLATYYGTIQIGPSNNLTSFKVLFDTGSCEFWVPSMACDTRRCQRHSRMPLFSHQKAATAKMNIQYLSGRVQGDMIYETVTLGDIQVDGQVVGLGKVVDIELLDDVRWDGILGLAYPNPALTAQGITPIFDTIIHSHVLSKKGLSNQFAYYISDHKGSVTFGGADCDLISKGDKAGCINKFKFVPVTEKTYWTVTIQDVRVRHPGQAERRAGCGATGCKAIVDTGTYLIYGPDRQVNSLLSTTLNSCASLDKMPTFIFEFKAGGGSTVEMELKPEDYVLKFNLNGRDDCVVGISPDKDTIWTLGQVFLRSFYTVFDRDADRIGFARLPRTGFNPINAPEVVQKAEERARAHEAAAPPTNKKMGFRQRMETVEAKRLKTLHKSKHHHHHHHHSHHHRHNERFAELRHAPAQIETDATTRASFDGPRHVHFERQGNL